MSTPAKKPVPKAPAKAAAAKPVEKPPVKAPTKPAEAKPIAKAPAKAVAKPAPKVKPADPKPAAAKPVQKAVPAPAKPEKGKSSRVIRDSFTFPEADYQKISALKKDCLAMGINAKKSEILRAGLHMLASLSKAKLKETISKVEKIKTGRPLGSDKT